MGGLWNQVAWGQQTLAARALAAGWGRVGGKRSARKRRKARAASSTRTRRKARRKTGRKVARLVKGSRAAKAYMAKIRRKRRK